MEDGGYFLRFGVAVAIGVLVGFQRQFAIASPDKECALGVRTFALLGLIGCSAALICDILKSPLPLVITILVVGVFLAVDYYIEASKEKIGLTTDAAAILTVLAGTLAYWNHLTLAVALGVITTVLLSAKTEMHNFAAKMTRTDIFASLKFAVITAIVLPVLPNKTYGIEPFDIFNPRKIWLLVVFICGINFVGFILIKLVGARKGIGITGLLGGIASSTALTLGFTQRSRQNGSLAKSFAMAIIIAWTVMFLRVIVEVAVLNIELVKLITLPITVPAALGLLYCFYLYRAQANDKSTEDIDLSNPFELNPAIKFGMIFTAILLISKISIVYFGEAGVYISSFLSGLADVDAIALSLADLSRKSAEIDYQVAARAIVIAAISNTLAKGGIVIFAGVPALRKAILPGYLLMLAAGIAGAVLI
ncbi:MgtC/SapB family protein [Fibrobacterota bacterium]